MARRRVAPWLVALVPIVVALALALALAIAIARPGARRLTGDVDDTPDRTAAPSMPSPPGGAMAGARATNRSAAGARSEQGAAAAAASYLATLETLVDRSPPERTAALERLAATDAADVVEGVLGGLEHVDVAVAEARYVLPDAAVWVREVPVAYHVAAYEPTRARVEVWSLGVVLIEGRTEATQVWSTNVVELRWEADGWRVASWSRSPGPTPATAPAAPTPPSGVLATIEGWERYRYVPES